MLPYFSPSYHIYILHFEKKNTLEVLGLKCLFNLLMSWFRNNTPNHQSLLTPPLLCKTEDKDYGLRLKKSLLETAMT